MIEKLITEMAEIRRSSQIAVRNQPPSASSNSTQSEVPRPMDVTNDEGDKEKPAPKKRAITPCEQVPTRAKSEVKEMLTALSESVKQINERLTQFQSGISAMEERTNQRFLKIEAYLNDTVVPALAPTAPEPLVQRTRSHSLTKLNNTPQPKHDGCTN